MSHLDNPQINSRNRAILYRNMILLGEKARCEYMSDITGAAAPHFDWPNRHRLARVVRGRLISPGDWSKWNGGAGWRSAAGHAANVGTNTSDAGGLRRAAIRHGGLT